MSGQKRRTRVFNPLLGPQPFDAACGLGRGVTGADLAALARAAGLELPELAAWAGRSERSVARMIGGQTQLDLALLRLVAVLAGTLPHPGWRRHAIVDGVLFCRERPRERYRPRDLAQVTRALALAQTARAVLAERGISADERFARLPQLDLFEADAERSPRREQPGARGIGRTELP